MQSLGVLTDSKSDSNKISQVSEMYIKFKKHSSTGAGGQKGDR